METENDQQDKPDKPVAAADTDAYYGEDDMEMGDLDLSFLDEDDKE